MPKPSIPENIALQLAEADKRNGFPPGTMASVMQQEGGMTDRILKDPTAYHYEANDKGQRIAPHTGKVSTAFGPFGILESTGRDPGYGVKPLASKDIGEQIRFASDYLAARTKAGGSLHAGLAGYGEGDKYATQVLARGRGGSAAPASVPAAVAAPPIQMAASPAAAAGAPVIAPVQLAQADPLAGELAAASDGNAWLNFVRSLPSGKRPVAPTDLQYGQATQAMAPPAMTAPAPIRNVVPNFEAFSGFGRRRA